MVKVLQKVWSRLFGRSEKQWRIQFRILNLEEMAKRYGGGDSPGYLAECVWTRWPKGVMIFPGNEKERIIHAHICDNNVIQPEGIKKFLFEEYGAQVEEVGRTPYKRFFGIEFL